MEEVIKKKEVEKKPLNIIIANGTKPQNYLDFLSLRYDVKVLDPSKEKIARVDLLLFTGGEDVTPSYYGDEIGKFTQINERRDEIEQNIFQKWKYVPKLGICRGAQFLTVMAGGKLIQHVTNHGVPHRVVTHQYPPFEISSTHHQMMYPFDLPEEKYELLGWSEFHRSTTYLNGKNEEIKKPMTFLEPEIVEYPKIKALCIQGHPETSSLETKELALDMLQAHITEHSKPKAWNPEPQIGGEKKRYLEFDETVPRELGLRPVQQSGLRGSAQAIITGERLTKKFNVVPQEGVKLPTVEKEEDFDIDEDSMYEDDIIDDEDDLWTEDEEDEDEEDETEELEEPSS